MVGIDAATVAWERFDPDPETSSLHRPSVAVAHVAHSRPKRSPAPGHSSLLTEVCAMSEPPFIEPELVEEGRELLARERTTQWEIADLTRRVEPLGSKNKKNGSYRRLRAWADAIGWPYQFGTLRMYRETAEAWPDARRLASTCFSAHADLRHHRNRFKLLKAGMTLQQARDAAGFAQRKSKTAVPPSLIDDLHDGVRRAAGTNLLELLAAVEEGLEHLLEGTLELEECRQHLDAIRQAVDGVASTRNA
jgi:hypothetical protein